MVCLGGNRTKTPWSFWTPAQPPSPTTSAVVWQPLCSPSAHHLCRWDRRGSASLHRRHAGGSFVSASSLWIPDCALALWPSGSTMAPSSFIYDVALQSTSSAGLPSPSGSTLVSRRPSATSGLHSSGYTSSLRLCQAAPSLRFHLVLCHLRLHRGLPDPPLLPRSPDPSAPPWPSGSSPSPGSSALRSASGSSSTVPPAVGQHPGVVSLFLPPRVLPPSAPPWAAIMVVASVPAGSSYSKGPPVSVLAPPSVWSALGTFCLHPGGDDQTSPSSAGASTCLVCLPSCQPFAIPCHHPFLHSSCPPPKSPLRPSLFVYGARLRLPGGGWTVTVKDVLLLFFLPLVPIFDGSCSRFVIISSSSSPVCPSLAPLFIV